MSCSLPLLSTVLFILVMWSVSGQRASLRIKPRSKIVKVLEGFVARVDFTYTGKPNTTFMVRFNETLLDDHRFIFTDNSLTIKHVNKADEGKYWIYTMIAADSFLLVVEKGGIPKLVETYSKIQKIRSGGLVRFKCKTDARNGRRQVLWYHKDNLLNTHDRNPRIIIKRYTLEIKNVTTSDKGKYECKIDNSYGSVSFKYRLQVYRERKQNRAPVWLPCTTDAISRDVGDSVTFTCNAIGLPTPIIRWEKDGRRFLRNRNSGYTITHGKLVIQQLMMEDAGAYTCKVSNSRGNIRYTYHLTVKPANMTKANMDT